jgi:hypothetical protein
MKVLHLHSVPLSFVPLAPTGLGSKVSEVQTRIANVTSNAAAEDSFVTSIDSKILHIHKHGRERHELLQMQEERGE